MFAFGQISERLVSAAASSVWSSSGTGWRGLLEIEFTSGSGSVYTCARAVPFGPGRVLYDSDVSQSRSVIPSLTSVRRFCKRGARGRRRKKGRGEGSERFGGREIIDGHRSGRMACRWHVEILRRLPSLRRWRSSRGNSARGSNWQGILIEPARYTLCSLVSIGVFGN